MIYDFIEIGTSNFRTLIETCKPNSIGISVEPIKQYLDDLPDKKNVTKVNVAITGDKTPNEKIKIYYIPQEVLIEKNLAPHLRGCNKVGGYHPLHIKNKIEHLVVIEEVDVINIGDFFVKYNVEGVDYLKIDTEGYDINIMIGLYKYISDLPNGTHPKKITFETNTNTPTFEVDGILNLFNNLGYSIVSRGYDTTIKKQ